MAQTKKKRRKKRRGTQGGRIDTKGRGRPRNRQEAQARARARSSGKGKKQVVDRRDIPPTWRGAGTRAFIAAFVFALIMWLAFGRTIAQASLLGLFMFGIYLPMGYYTDSFFYRRRQRALQRERAAQAQSKGKKGG